MTHAGSQRPGHLVAHHEQTSNPLWNTRRCLARARDNASTEIVEEFFVLGFSMSTRNSRRSASWLASSTQQVQCVGKPACQSAIERAHRDAVVAQVVSNARSGTTRFRRQRTHDDIVAATGDHRVPAQVGSIAQLQVIAIDEQKAAALHQRGRGIPQPASRVPPVEFLCGCICFIAQRPLIALFQICRAERENGAIADLRRISPAKPL